MTEDPPPARLSAFLGSAITIRTQELSGGRAIAVGWATVDLERAVVELGAALRLPSERFTAGAGTPTLGARCRVAAGVLEGGVSLALLEPSTEGRLAATLARHGEGPAAVWLRVDNLADAVAALVSSGTRTSLALAGPFGVERLVLDETIHGAHRLLIERPGTIRA